MPVSIQQQILEKIASTLAFGRKPVIILDIDDTLVDCRYRKLAVLQDFCSQLPSNHPFREQLSKITLNHIHYRVAHCLDAIGIDDQIFGKELFDFWLAHYFTSPYLVNDVAFPGAEYFAQTVIAAGGSIIYLTGRDKPGMEAGTISYLSKSHFPFPHQQVELVMKPSSEESDGAFKEKILDELKTRGEIIASFENELSHLNHMATYFPDGIMVWRDTQYMPDPPAPHPRVQVLKEF